MNERIKNLVNKTIKGEMFVEPIKTQFQREDLFLHPIKMSSKRVCEYIINQEPMITEDSLFTGLLTFDGSVEGDIFGRSGHKNFQIGTSNFYNKPVNNLITFEWQHSAGNFEKILNGGIQGILKEIQESKEYHIEDEKAVEFLDTQIDVCNAIINWAHKCSDKALSAADKANDITHKKNLIKLSKALKKVPEYPVESFYEAVLCLYLTYSFIPDSIGLIDRYLYPFFSRDLENGIITENDAICYLQELFLMLQARISIKSDRFYRGGETHFCVGGYLHNGKDGFNEFSKLIVDALLELPTWIPQISLRWTEKTPTEVLKYMLDCERKDKNKRIAFVNDEPRIKGLMKYSNFSYDEAINYSMIGCNELVLPGGIVFGFDPINIVRSLANVYHKREKEIVHAKSFDEFFNIYKNELFKDLWEAEKISKGFQDIRSRDCNIVSNIFIDGCIENAKSVTQGGASKYTAIGLIIGITTVIDSLSVTKQFVFDEKTISMAVLVCALKENWKGHEDLRNIILKKGNFFGNDDECSNRVARMFTKALEEWNNDTNYLKRKWIFGNLIGYNAHHKFFGDNTPATPDGRLFGDIISYGIGQNNGKDRNGLTALLNSIAKCDPDFVMTGPSVTNVLIDEKLIMEDSNFEKLVYVFETYFKTGGTHFQLNYLNKDDLVKAQARPLEYKNLRVRVSGFSDYFVNLNKDLQDEIVQRTEHTS